MNTRLHELMASVSFIVVLSFVCVQCIGLVSPKISLAQTNESLVVRIKVTNDREQLIKSNIQMFSHLGPEQTYHAPTGEWFGTPFPCPEGRWLKAFPTDIAYTQSDDVFCQDDPSVELRVRPRHIVSTLVRNGLRALTVGNCGVAAHAFVELAAGGDFPTHELGWYIAGAPYSDITDPTAGNGTPRQYWRALDEFWASLEERKALPSVTGEWASVAKQWAWVPAMEEFTSTFRQTTGSSPDSSAKMWGYGQYIADVVPEYWTYWQDPMDWYSVQSENFQYWTQIESGLGAILQVGDANRAKFAIPADMAVKGLMAQALPLKERSSVDFKYFMELSQNVSGKTLANNAAVICLSQTLGVSKGAHYDKLQGQFVFSQDLQDALKVFQASKGIQATGKLNYHTIETISGIRTADLLYEDWLSDQEQEMRGAE